MMGISLGVEAGMKKAAKGGKRDEDVSLILNVRVFSWGRKGPGI